MLEELAPNPGGVFRATALGSPWGSIAICLGDFCTLDGDVCIMLGEP